MKKNKKELDRIREELSKIIVGDACGSLDYCSYCPDEKEFSQNRCDVAYQRMVENKRYKSKAILKANGETVVFRATVVEDESGVSG